MLLTKLLADGFVTHSSLVEVYNLISDVLGENTPTITIIDHTFLCKSPNLRNRQGFKYLFSPLYMEATQDTHTHAGLRSP